MDKIILKEEVKKNIFIANVPHMNILSFYKETKNIDVKKQSFI